MRTEVTPQKINKIMERSFGFTIDYDNMTFGKAKRLSKALNENIRDIKKSFGSHTAEKNPKYMELMMVKEGLDRWMHSEQGLFESELGAAEVKLAAQDIVKQIEDMIKKVSKIQNEQFLELVTTIGDQLSLEQANAFKSSMEPLLQNLYDSLKGSFTEAQQAVFTLTGDQQAQPSDMNMPGADQGMPQPGMGGDGFGTDELGGGGEMPPPESDFDSDEFGGEMAAAGGEDELGRPRR
jgi:hypothetical protein